MSTPSPQIILNIIDSDFQKYPALPYIHPENAIALALSLTAFGHISFQIQFKIEHWNDFDALHKKMVSGTRSGEEGREFVEHHLSDTANIITCFENYMKAVLLTKDFLVHNIKRMNTKRSWRTLFKKFSIEKKCNDFKKTQLKEPVLVSDLRKVKNFELTEKNTRTKWDVIESTTLSFTTLLKTGYQKHINLPMDVLNALNRINQYRNSLHFYVFGKLDEISYNDTLTLKNFVPVIAALSNALDKGLKDRRSALIKT